MNDLPKCMVCDKPGATLQYKVGTDVWYVHPKCWEQVRGEFVEQAEKVKK